MLIPINFHYIRKSFEYEYPSIFGKTPEQFKSQLLRLKSIFDFVSQDQIIDRINSNSTFSKDSAVITFDDGLKEQYINALPILDDLSIPAIFYINTSNITEKKIQLVHKLHLIRSVCSPKDILPKILSINSSLSNEISSNNIREKASSHYLYDDNDTATLKFVFNFLLDMKQQKLVTNELFNEFFGDREREIHSNLYMNEDMIKDLLNRNYIGAHGHTHRPIGLLSNNEKCHEIKSCQKVFNKYFGVSVPSFSYPYGSYEASQGLDVILKNNDFKFAFSMERAKNENFETPYLLSRIDNNDAPGGKSYNNRDLNFVNDLRKKNWK